MPTIYHNPRCSKSRQTLSLLQDQGLEPEIVLYLETPPSAQTIATLLQQLGLTARQLLRRSEQEYKDQNLADTSLSEQQLIEAMANSPKLIERPIVVNGNRAAIGRPPECVLEVL
jgi:arsenate reductase (glutaredoxin)